MRVQVAKRLSLDVVVSDEFQLLGQNDRHEVEFDFSLTTQIDLDAWLVWKAVCDKARSDGTKINLTNYPRESKNLEIAGYDATLGRQDVGTSTVYRVLKLQRERIPNWLEAKFNPWLSERLDLQNQSVAELEVCFKELFNNVQDHSGQTDAYVLLRDDPKKSEFRILVCDLGVGIPKSLSTIARFASDGDALLEAIKEGVTAQSSRGNRGAGLPILIDNATAHRDGLVKITSGFAQIISSRPNKKLVTIIKSLPQGLNGTLVDLRFRRSMLQQDASVIENVSW
jgi:anti-sigma regulatory factor (Ser/Thr protein kinase)